MRVRKMQQPFKTAPEVENPNGHPAKLIADSILEIAEGVRKMNASRLSRKAIITLLWQASGVGKSSVEAVLDALDGLEATWLKKK